MGDINKFNIGDRVIYRYIKNKPQLIGGNPNLDEITGIVVDEGVHNRPFYYVFFDKKFPNGHSCGGRIPDGYGYGVSPEFLHLINNDTENKTIRWYKNGKLSKPE